MNNLKNTKFILCELWGSIIDCLTQTVRVRVGDRIERVATPFNLSDLNDLFGEGNWKLLGEFEASFQADKKEN